MYVSKEGRKEGRFSENGERGGGGGEVGTGREGRVSE